jgi:hypothetical protein
MIKCKDAPPVSVTISFTAAQLRGHKQASVLAEASVLAGSHCRLHDDTLSQVYIVNKEAGLETVVVRIQDLTFDHVVSCHSGSISDLNCLPCLQTVWENATTFSGLSNEPLRWSPSNIATRFREGIVFLTELTLEGIIVPYVFTVTLFVVNMLILMSR